MTNNNQLVMATIAYNKLWFNLSFSIRKLHELTNRNHAWINRHKKRMLQMNDDDVYTFDEKLYCANCRERWRILIEHHDHVSGKYITFLCPSCNKLIKNARSFSWVKLKFDLKDYRQMVKLFNAETPDDVIEELLNLFYKEKNRREL